jgi:hypothetical protein
MSRCSMAWWKRRSSALEEVDHQVVPVQAGWSIST